MTVPEPGGRNNGVCDKTHPVVQVQDLYLLPRQHVRGLEQVFVEGNIAVVPELLIGNDGYA